MWLLADPAEARSGLYRCLAEVRTGRGEQAPFDPIGSILGERQVREVGLADWGIVHQERQLCLFGTIAVKAIVRDVYAEMLAAGTAYAESTVFKMMQRMKEAPKCPPTVQRERGRGPHRAARARRTGTLQPHVERPDVIRVVEN